MTPATVITQVRRLIQDETTTYRYSDTVLLGFINQALKRIALLRPDLFTTITTFAAVEGAITQTLPATATRLVEIFQVVGGNAVEEVVREIYDRVNPGWVAEANGTPTKYMRHPRNPTAFHLYPKPTTGVTLSLEYVVWPADYANVSDTITAPSGAYFSAIVDATVWLAESIDNEHVDSGRAKMFYDSFTSSLGISSKVREVTDSEAAGTGLPPFA